MLAKTMRNWWALALRGVLAIIFGILALIWPGITILTLVILFGVYAFVDGIFAVVAGLSLIGKNNRWWAMVLVGLVGVVIGVLTFLNPSITALGLLTYIAIWAIITGIFDIVAAVQLRHEISSEWLMILSGVISVIFGVLLILFPGAGALSLTWMIAIFAIIFGVLLMILAFRLRNFMDKLKDTGEGNAFRP